ncbi:hypothetical protein BK004_00535 [bacterium CG10_46_32]|nr:MAG: hypothetical protein BK004_00535 [bacterium CG10_46_32]PIR56382.1 MAG: hypothetical protein COU73_00535 [Parcubacteria group bacterium CG10_big_fil_rev_8_21_14_0_10_46_32]
MAQNLTMPGNPRYQPKELVPYFGYDNLYTGLARVEIATLETLGQIGMISTADMALLTPEIIERLIAITTSHVDDIEYGRNGYQATKHDVRAWVRAAQEVLDPRLGRWVHVPLTSYDALDTGRILQYRAAYNGALKPALTKVINIFIGMVRQHADTLQIGRTHGQHALPITIGFWLATILDRLVRNAMQLDIATCLLMGKISGAVGAYNAQVGLGFSKSFVDNAAHVTFEKTVLDKLDLNAAPTSTQILPPEPLANFLYACTLLTASFGQFGRDCRNLMRSEISEVREEYETGQVGSSTMGQKRNPLNFEQLEGMWHSTKYEFAKVLDMLLSEHQRDLVGSSVMRNFPIILINLQCQIDTLLRPNKAGTPFLSRISINEEACRRNFNASAKVVLAEPLYIALLMAGYEGDAHALVNEVLMPRAQKKGRSLIEEFGSLAGEVVSRGDADQSVARAYGNIPVEISDLLQGPEKYIGAATEKALQIANTAEAFVATV